MNVRTYVTLDGKPGVFFFSLDAGSALPAAAARTLFHLPYFTAEMHVYDDGPWVRYDCRREAADQPPAEFRAAYRPAGDVFAAQPDSLEYFVAECYCLYTAADNGDLYRCDIHHGPWPLQHAEAEIEVNTMARTDGIALPDRQPVLHFARLQPAVVWAPEKLRDEG